MTMRHDISTELVTARDVRYGVVPCSPGPAPFVSPVVLTIDLTRSSPFRVQDYLTIDEAERLARALLDGARKARELEPRVHDRYCISSDPDHEGPCKTEPTDDELANGHGVEGGIGYDTTPDMRDEHDPSL